jgi:hypothetical protein
MSVRDDAALRRDKRGPAVTEFIGSTTDLVVGS